MISLLCPTRNRVAKLKRMWESVQETADNPDQIELVLYVDHDDSNTLSFLQSNLKDANVTVSDPDKKEIYSNLHNICCERATHNIVMGCADDVEFQTGGWDTEVIRRFSEIDDGIGFVYPNDGRHGEVLGTHGFFTKTWYFTLGYLAPPIFSVDYSDNYVMEVSRAIGRAFYMPDVLVEHMHWTFGKSDFDQTAREAHHRRQTTNNAQIFESSKPQMQQDIQKLRAKINEA